MLDLKENDRIGKYLISHIEKLIFIELKKEFWKKIDKNNELEDILIPISENDLEKIKTGINLTHFVDNMVLVIGANPNFKYSSAYIKIIKKIFKEDFIYHIIQRGMNEANQGNFEKACIYFRFAIIIDNKSQDGMYNYARICRDIYSESNDEEKIGLFKAEAISVFEQMIIDFPEFSESYYFLGYLYLNMGLYEKAGLVWERYIAISNNEEAIVDISKRLREIAEPREIESGCNKVISGRYKEGYNILVSFLDSNYSTWWPLHFYLAIASEELGNLTNAEMRYKEVLKLQPSCIDAIDGLIRIYRTFGNEELLNKYEQKKIIIRNNFNENSIDT